MDERFLYSPWEMFLLTLLDWSFDEPYRPIFDDSAELAETIPRYSWWEMFKLYLTGN